MSQTYQETHQKILDHLFELGQEKGLTKVKVTDITKDLGINRGTFYLHFLDIPDAMEQLEIRLLKPLLNMYGDWQKEHSLGANKEEELLLYLSLCQRIEDDSDIWQFLFSEKGDPRFEQTIRHSISPLVAINLQTKETTSQASFIHTLIVDNLISIFRHWLLQEPTISAEVVSQIIYDTRHQSPFGLGGID